MMRRKMRRTELFVVLAVAGQVVCLSYKTDDYYEVPSDRSDFQQLIASPYFVDKTGFIKKFLDTRMSVVYIMAPKRFGKTANMDIVKRFLECKVYDNGTRIPKNENKNFKLFNMTYMKWDSDTNTVNDRKELDVFEDEVFFNKNFGEFPVIHIDFKTLSGTNYLEILESFGDVILEVFNAHKYLHLSDKLNEDDKKYLMTLHNKARGRELTKGDVKCCLKYLSAMLECHFERPVFVLIDEFDVPVQNAIFKSGQDLENILDLIEAFASNLFKSNPSVIKALITTCLRISGSLTAAANNVRYFPFTVNHLFEQYFGFTMPEVKDLAYRNNASDQIDNIVKWYDGYVIPSTEIRLFNPYSISSYFLFNQFQNYWVQTGMTKNLEKILFNEEIRSDLDMLIRSESVIIDVVDAITIDHIKFLKGLVDGKKKDSLDQEDKWLFFSLLLDMGYLTAKERHGLTVVLEIPNLELKEEFVKQMRYTRYFREKLRMNDGQQKNFINSIKSLDLKNEASIHKVGVCLLDLFKDAKFPEDERNLRDILYYILKDAKPQFKRVEIEKPVKKIIRKIKPKATKGSKTKKETKSKTREFAKCIDMVIVINDEVGIVVELKYDNAKRNNRDNATTAILQIIENEYANIFKKDDFKVKQGMCLGIFLKRLSIKTKEAECYLSYQLPNKEIVYITVNNTITS